MKLVNILEVVKIANKSVSRFSGVKKYIATGDLSENIITSYNEVMYDMRPSRANVEVETGQVIFARMKDTKKVLLIDDDNVDFIYSTGFCVFEPTKAILSDYLRLILSSDLFQNQKDKYSKGATQKAINNTGLKKIQIPLPSLETQKKIIKVLDKAQGLIDRRKKQVNLLDELVVSLYYDEVGCNSNEYGRWKEVTIEDIADNKKNSIRSGPFGSDLLHSEFVSKGIYVLGIDNVVTNSFSWGKERYITKEKYETLKRYKVSAGDVLISIMGTTGRSAVVPNDFPIAINSKHLACITPNMHIINPLFLSLTITKNQSVLNQIKSKNKGAIMNGLNLGIIKKLTIKLPPIKTQNEFIERVENIHKEKCSMNESLIELENNYKSIMQTTFKSELN